MGRYGQTAFRSIPSLALLYCLFLSQNLFALPDPRDSVIIESKIIFSETSPVYVRVYITNKDTLSAYSFAFVERSLSGGAYLVWAQPRTFGNAVRLLDSTLQFFKGLGTAWYNGTPPDTIAFCGFYDPNDVDTWQPPNLVRKAFAEIKFDSTRGDGTVEIDSILVMRGSPTPIITNTRFYRLREVGGTQEVPVNFKKGTIIIKPVDLDLTGDGIINLYDLAVAINCVYLGTGDCPGVSTPADLTKLVKAVFSTNFTAPPKKPVEDPVADPERNRRERSRGVEK